MTVSSRLAAARGLHASLGAPVPYAGRPHVERTSVDAIANFARAYGDDNPVFVDAAYAATSVRGRLIAPPLFPIATGSRRPDLDCPDDVRAHLDRLGSGTQRMTSDDWSLLRPIPIDLRLERVDRLLSVQYDDDASEVLVGTRSEYAAEGVVYALRDRQRHYLTYPPPRRVRPLTVATHSAAEMLLIAQAYDDEQRRGASTRIADDVAVGDKLATMVKGPMTVTDLVNYRSGVGPGPLGAESNKLGHRNFRQRPDLYDLNHHGVFETRERVHWDEAYAISQGHPTAYDYSHTRPVWLSHLLTNWIGDGGWIASLQTALVGFNHVGDVHRLEGTVRAVDRRPSHGTIVVELRATNQRGEVTCHGSADLLLPRHGRPSAIPEDATAR